jgi:hypothetical protein
VPEGRVSHISNTLSLSIQPSIFGVCGKRTVADPMIMYPKYNLKQRGLYTMASKSYAALQKSFLRKHHFKQKFSLTWLLRTLM